MRIADARLADHLPVELRKTPDKRQPESAAAQRKEPWSERNTGEIQQREVDSKKRQVGIQPSGSRSTGSGYGSERPGRKQSLLCRFGRAQNTVLHCREDTGPKSRGNGKRYCCCTVCLLSRLVKTITRDWGTEFANWRRMEERLHCEVYFTDPYCAWQKGAIENLNGLLREFYLRGRNLSRVVPATLKRDLALLNARPRKVLNFHSAQD